MAAHEQAPLLRILSSSSEPADQLPNHPSYRASLVFAGFLDRINPFGPGWQKNAIVLRSSEFGTKAERICITVRNFDEIDHELFELDYERLEAALMEISLHEGGGEPSPNYQIQREDNVKSKIVTIIAADFERVRPSLQRFVKRRL